MDNSFVRVGQGEKVDRGMGTVGPGWNGTDPPDDDVTLDTEGSSGVVPV